MAGELEETIRLLRQHLRAEGLPDGSQVSPWALALSPLGGRGLVATRDITAGEVVFYDAPLVVGPRAGVCCPPVCVGCHVGSDSLVPCSRGCGLPVCSAQCESVSHHRLECDKLRSWGVRTNGSWSQELLRASVPVRCLTLSPLKRQVLQCLQSNNGPQHAFEIDILKRNTDKGPSTEEEEFMRLACCVMDANAFETAQISEEMINNKPSISTEEERPLNGVMPSLRGLYPLAAMMNHACTPNSRHEYDERQRMTVRAASVIPAGTEITNSYTSLLWGSSARRHHLATTKHFFCTCPRCSDPQECEILSFTPREENRLRVYENEVFRRTYISMQQLERKERLCRELLLLLVNLGAGQCRMRGLLLYELHCTLMEMRLRRREDLNTNSSDAIVQDIGREALACVEEAVDILGQDITAPLDIQHRLLMCRETVTEA